MTAQIDLDKLEQVAQSIEHGLWDYGGRAFTDEGGYYFHVSDESGNDVLGEYGADEKEARYIAAACPAVVLELVLRLRAAEENAARYIWLRDSDMLGSPSVEIAYAFERYAGSRLDGVIDAAIDAERAAKGASHD